VYLVHVTEGKRGAATAASVREGTAVEFRERQSMVSLLLALAGSVRAEVRRERSSVHECLSEPEERQRIQPSNIEFTERASEMEPALHAPRGCVL
jgi:hypothetical protein